MLREHFKMLQSGGDKAGIYILYCSLLYICQLCHPHIQASTELLHSEPHLVDDSQKLSRMIAFKTMRTLEFSSMDVVLLQELVDEVGALVSLLIVGK